MKNQLTAILVDDEPNGLENLSLLLQEFCPDVLVLATAATLLDAEAAIRSHQPDLLFLDIQIGSQTIFEMLGKLDRIDFEIIFVTAYDHFALKAIEFMALDYLLKPIEIPKLLKAVDKARSSASERSIGTHLQQLMLNLKNLNSDQHKIAFATSEGYELVYVSSLLYIQADGSYSHIHFKDGSTITVSRHLKFYERLLEEYGFLRIHQSALVSLRYIQKVARSEGGYVEMEDGKRLPISKTKRQELESAIKTKRRVI